MTDEIAFPSQGELVSYVFNAFGVLPTKHSSDFEEQDKTKFQRLLKRLKDKGYRTAILSDKREAFGVAELAFSKLGDSVDRALFFTDGMDPKPDPSGLQDMMGFLEVAPSETLFVGDSHRDIECAKRAGAWSGAALWASVEPDLVLALKPDLKWETVDDVGVTLDLGRTG